QTPHTRLALANRPAEFPKRSCIATLRLEGTTIRSNALLSDALRCRTFQRHRPTRLHRETFASKTWSDCRAEKRQRFTIFFSTNLSRSWPWTGLSLLRRAD